MLKIQHITFLKFDGTKLDFHLKELMCVNVLNHTMLSCTFVFAELPTYGKQIWKGILQRYPEYK